MARKRKRGSRRRHTATLTSFAQNRFNDDLDIRSGGSEKGNLAVHDVETFGHDKVQSSSHEAGGISQSERPHLLYTLHEEGHHLPQTRHEAAAPSSKLTSEPSRSPSADYLSISTTPSLRLDVPSALRKLLILDLNGTLLLRSPHQRQHRYGNPPTRKVHPRPYLGTFVSYLFHEEVQKWLDTMVWSSARPHNVADMTETCFGGKRRRLVAIWTRDDMGLTEAEYCEWG